MACCQVEKAAPARRRTGEISACNEDSWVAGDAVAYDTNAGTEASE